MKNLRLLVALLFGCAVGAAAQTTATSYSFKGNTLGMTLADFKTSNATFQCYTYDEAQQPLQYMTALTEAMANEALLDSKVKGAQMSLRFGTAESKGQAQQELNSLIPEDNKARDLVIALKQQTPPKPLTWTMSEVAAAPFITCASTSTEPVEVGSAKAEGVAYQFFNDKLAGIVVLFSSGLFKEITAAFTEKYGAPKAAPPDDYQNAYGAHWRGANFVWDNGGQHIFVHEGSGNGPAQHDDVTGRVIYTESTLLPAEKKAPVNF